MKTTLLLCVALTWSLTYCQPPPGPVEPLLPDMSEMEEAMEEMVEGMEDGREPGRGPRPFPGVGRGPLPGMEPVPGRLPGVIPPGMREEPPVGPGIDPGLGPGLREEELVRCTRPLCDLSCPYGHHKGEDGCDICRCLTAEDVCDRHECPEEGTRCHLPTCEGILCSLVKPICIPECPLRKCVPCPSNVYLKDNHGCQTCECGPATTTPPTPPMPCAIPMCTEHCEHGYANDDNGCMTCNCKTEGCSRRMCRMFCEYGFQKDLQGCEICRCRDQPAECSDIMCMMYCEYGFEKDQHGCDICRCRESPVACPAVLCERECEFGFMKDPKGCQTCRCKPPTLNACATMFCEPGLRCKEVLPGKGVCRPPSICELHQDRAMADEDLEMLMHHLTPAEEDMFYPGPARCTPGGEFEPQQCVDDQCFCVDDRGVMLGRKMKVGDLNCIRNLTKTMELAFRLEHDLDDNDLDGAFEDIKKLVYESVGDWMAMDRSAVVEVQVVYVKPGLLAVTMKVVHGEGLYDLGGAAHHLLKNMRQGRCDLHYKHHVLKPQHETFHATHHYDPKGRMVNEPHHHPWITKCFGYVRHPSVLVIVLPVGAALLIIVITVIACCVKKRKQSASYQFKHKKMENMENFKKNLILSTEWEKPDLVCKDDVKVTLTDDMEKKPIA